MKESLTSDCEKCPLRLCECFLWIELTNPKYKKQVSNYLLNNIDTLKLSSDFSKDYLLDRYLQHNPEQIFSYPEICLAKTLNTIINNFNLSRYDTQSMNISSLLFLMGLEYIFAPFLYFVYKISNDINDSEELENGVGLKTGHGETNIEENDIHENDIDDDAGKEEEENDLNNEGIEMSNEGELNSVSNENASDDGVDAENNECESKEDSNEDKSVVNDENMGNEIEDTSQQEVEGIEKRQEEESGDKSYSSTQEELCTGSDEASNIVSDQDEALGNYEHTHNYEWKESIANRDQTCEAADGYNKKVEGSNLEEQNALKEGLEGNEFVEGEGETGKEILPYSKSVKFQKSASDCTKLINLLQIVFESNKQNKYKGEYKSGKKLNLKKIVPYIASNYQKDKIWMKRQRNDKKNYNLRIFIDNSKSMFDQTLVNVLSSIYYKINYAFSYLNIPVELYKFGSELKRCEINDLSFDEDHTYTDWIYDFNDGINIVLTDGIFNKPGYIKNNFLTVMIDKGNVKKMSKVSVVDSKVFIEKYLDTFALKYCIIENIEDLENVFIEALAGIIKNSFY